jgi:hypothetical protein
VINIQLAGSNQNHKTSAYMIEDQTQYHRTLIQHHAILHQKDAGMQHPFQLCQQRNLFSFFVPVIMWQEMTVTVKKESFTSIC